MECVTQHMQSVFKASELAYRVLQFDLLLHAKVSKQAAWRTLTR